MILSMPATEEVSVGQFIDDITQAEVKEEIIINHRYYHTIKEVKNGEGPHPIKTSAGWLHLAHGVRACAAGLRYVLYLYMTALDEPWKLTAEPAGYFWLHWAAKEWEMYPMCYSLMVGLQMRTVLYISIMHPVILVCMW